MGISDFLCIVTMGIELCNLINHFANNISPLTDGAQYVNIPTLNWDNKEGQVPPIVA